MKDLSSIEITKLIPQRHPLIFVDSVFEFNEDYCKTKFHINEKNIFVKNGELSTAGIIENIAQSAAAMTGVREYYLGLEPAIGFIGSVTNVKIFNHPKAGMVIETIVIETEKIMDAAIIKGIVQSSQGIIAECEMRIFIKKSKGG